MQLTNLAAKVILFGEHAVVYGKPAVAAALSRRTFLHVHRAKGTGELKLSFPDIDVSILHLSSSTDACACRWNRPGKWMRSSRSSLTLPVCAPSRGLFFFFLIGFAVLKDERIMFDQAILHTIESRLCKPGTNPAVAAFLYLYLAIFRRKLPYLHVRVTSTIPVGSGTNRAAPVIAFFFLDAKLTR